MLGIDQAGELLGARFGLHIGRREHLKRHDLGLQHPFIVQGTLIRLHHVIEFHREQCHLRLVAGGGRLVAGAFIDLEMKVVTLLVGLLRHDLQGALEDGFVARHAVQRRGDLGAGGSASGIGTQQCLDGNAGAFDQREAVLRGVENLFGQSALAGIDGAQDGQLAVFQLAVALRFFRANRLLQLQYLGLGDLQAVRRKIQRLIEPIIASKQ